MSLLTFLWFQPTYIGISVMVLNEQMTRASITNWIYSDQLSISCLAVFPVLTSEIMQFAKEVECDTDTHPHWAKLVARYITFEEKENLLERFFLRVS